jgi:NAD(P)-dependent dehydrogenase (short-subunit alcohol dehydrogenase family)
VHYPPQEACRKCLSVRLVWCAQDGAGELVTDTVLRHSNELYFRARLPVRIGSVRLDAGPTAIAFVHAACKAPPARVRLTAALDRIGAAVLAALPFDEVTTMADDHVLRELTNDPAGRKILITDGRAAVAAPLARSLAEAGAERIYVGMPEPWPPAVVAAFAQIPEVLIRPLDLTDSASVADFAAEIAGKVDILVNTAEHHRPHGVLARGIETARAEMEVNYFGLLRLAHSFAPALRARAADGATAWVNVLSIFALTSFPPHGTFSASQAAAHSLAQSLRAELREAGLRVVNVYPGPIDEEWNDALPPPKLAPGALAAAIVAALRDGIEDVYPGDVAQDWLARWRDNPKALEREAWHVARNWLARWRDNPKALEREPP